MAIRQITKSAVKGAANGLHAGLSRNRWLSTRYLELLGWFCRAAPDAPWKAFVHNSVEGRSWPELRLAARLVRLPGSDQAIHIVPHLGEFDFAAAFYKTLPYEREVFEWLGTRRYAAVIDIGANVGVYSIYFARRFPNSEVFAFEPSRRAYQRLLANIAVNGCSNLLAFNCGVHDSSGLVTFHEPEGHLTNGSLDRAFASGFSESVLSTPVPMLAGAALEPLFGRSPLLVKVDAEGAEPEILEALTDLIARHRPDLLIEVLPDTAERLNQSRLVRGGAYRLLHLVPGTPVEREQFVASEHRDYALLPVQP